MRKEQPERSEKPKKRVELVISWIIFKVVCVADFR